MSIINEAIRRLRKAADALDELLDVMPDQNRRAAGAIGKAVTKNLNRVNTEYDKAFQSTGRRRRVMSKTARAAISKAQKARWAALRKDKAVSRGK